MYLNRTTERDPKTRGENYYMKKTKKALASLIIAGMTLTMVPFNTLASGVVPTRLAGNTASETAVAIADQTGWTGTAILASSTSYGMVDALTAGPLSYYLKAPILLTGAGNALDAATKAELVKLAVKTVYVTSGTAVIKQTVLNELKTMAITVESLGGNDKYDTSVNIAKKMVGVTKVAVVNGLQDALSIAAIASAANEPILLTAKAALPTSVAAYLAANPGITASNVIGGTGVISDVVTAVLPNATRHYGNTAYDTNNQVIKNFASSIDFGNVYVANGKTGIDALAGAPLAAQTNSAIVLTDGTLPAVATFVNDKLASNSVITALGGTFVVPVSVIDGVAHKAPTLTLSSIAITSPAGKTRYTIGEALEIGNLAVTGTYSDGTTQIEPLTASNITGFDSSVAVTSQELTITVGGKTATYTVAIENIAIVDKSALTAAINVEIGSNHEEQIYLLDSTKYTSESWSHYTDTVSIAIYAENSTSYPQEAIDSTTASIGAAKSLLAPRGTAGSQKQIGIFALISPSNMGVIDETTHTILIHVPFGSVVTDLYPAIVTNQGAVTSYISSRDFSAPVTITIMAQDGSTQNYVVTTIVDLA